MFVLTCSNCCTTTNQLLAMTSKHAPCLQLVDHFSSFQAEPPDSVCTEI
jgi:hypothetical protein